MANEIVFGFKLRNIDWIRMQLPQWGAHRAASADRVGGQTPAVPAGQDRIGQAK